MNADQILSRTFAEHEHLTPDPEAVLAGVHDRRRRVLPVAVAAVTVAAVAVGASLLVGRGPAAPAPAVSRPPATTAPAVPDTLSVAPGWLPAGKVYPVTQANSYGQQSRTYDIVTPDGAGMNVTIGLRPGTELPTENEHGTPRDVTIGGRPAREWSVAQYYTGAVRVPGDRIATVDVDDHDFDNSGPRPAAEVAGIGRRVLAGLRLDRPEPMDTTFRLTYVPAGLAVRAVSTYGNTTRYELNRPDSSERDPGTVTVEQEAVGPPAPPSRTPGRPVQGRPSWVQDAGIGQQLVVTGPRPGLSVALGPGAPLPELYRMADGIRWTG